MIQPLNIGNRPFLWLLAGSFFLRLLCVPLCHSVDYTADEKEYLFIAQKIVQEGMFIDSEGERSKRSPLFPAVLAGITMIAGDGLGLPHLIGCLLGTLAVALTYVLTEHIFGDKRASLMAAGAMAVYPGAVIYSSLLQTETLFIVLMLAALLSGYHAMRHQSIPAAAIMGITAGLAALTRATFLGAFPFLLASFFWPFRGRFGVRAWMILVAFLSFFAVVAPWTIRNFEVHGSFVPISSWSGRSLLIANNPFSTGTWSVKPGFDEWFAGEAERRGIRNVRGLPEAELDATSRAIGLEYMAAHPVEAASMALTRIHVFWVYPITHTDSYLPVQALAVAVDIVFLFGASLGLVLVKGRSSEFLPIAMIAGVLFLTHLVLQAEARYRLPLSPFLCMLFGAGASLVLSGVGSAKDRATALRVAGFAGAVLAAIYGYTAWLFLTHTIS